MLKLLFIMALAVLVPVLVMLLLPWTSPCCCWAETRTWADTKDESWSVLQEKVTFLRVTTEGPTAAGDDEGAVAAVWLGIWSSWIPCAYA